jgi:hypothetical protein
MNFNSFYFVNHRCSRPHVFIYCQHDTITDTKKRNSTTLFARCQLTRFSARKSSSPLYPKQILRQRQHISDTQRQLTII